VLTPYKTRLFLILDGLQDMAMILQRATFNFNQLIVQLAGDPNLLKGRTV
jgi:hypothetical protein